MSRLRPTLVTTTKAAISDATALYMIADAVAKRKYLIHGRLDDWRGYSCALGGCFNDNPNLVMHSSLIDEVATYNDSMPKATMRERRNRVLKWLRWRIRTLAMEHV